MEHDWNVGIEIDPEKKEVIFDISAEMKLKFKTKHISVRVKNFENFGRISNSVHFKIRIGLKKRESKEPIEPEYKGCEEVLEIYE